MQGLFRHAEILALGHVGPVAAQGVHAAEDGGNRLGDHRGQRRAGDAQGERHDKQQVKEDVEHAGDHQKIQRGAAVAHRPKDAGKHVVADGGKHARVDNGDIGVCVLEDGGRRVHKRHQRAQKAKGQQGQQRGHAGVEQDHARDGLAHAAQVARAKALGNDDGVAVVERPGKVDNQGIEGCGCADGGNRLIAQPVAHHHRIHHAVYLLEDVADKQRHRKPQDEGKRIALRHIEHAGGVRMRFFHLKCGSSRSGNVKLLWDANIILRNGAK